MARDSLTLFQRPPGVGPERSNLAEVSESNPLPVRAVGAVSVGRTRSVLCEAAGIGVAAAYADADALGTGFTIPLPDGARSGLLSSALYLDRDDEGLAIDLAIYSRPLATVPTDNSAFAPADTDSDYLVAVVQFTTFLNWGSHQTSFESNLGALFECERPGLLYGYLIARGALNIAAGNLPRFRLGFLLDG